MRRAAGLILIAISALTVVLAITLAGCPPPKKPMATNTQVSVIPSKTVVAPGESFTVDVKVDPAAGVNIAGWQFDLAWDPAALQVTSVVEGDLLKQSGKPTFFSSGNIDNNAGTLKSVYSAIEGAASVTSSGVMATITCTAKTKGKVSMFALSNVIVGNSLGQALPLASPIINQVAVALSSDLNLDGYVDVADMQVAAGLFGSTQGGRADVNADGVVNVLDLILVGQNFTT